MILGGLFGGADTSLGDSPNLTSSTATPIHPRSQTHSAETQTSIDEWIDRLRISSPLTQDLATVNTLTIALNLTKDQATSAILEALNEGDEDKETDTSRFQQVQDTFPELFERFLEVNDIAFPTLQPEWEGVPGLGSLGATTLDVHPWAFPFSACEASLRIMLCRVGFMDEVLIPEGNPQLLRGGFLGRIFHYEDVVPGSSTLTLLADRDLGGEYQFWQGV